MILGTFHSLVMSDAMLANNLAYTPTFTLEQDVWVLIDPFPLFLSALFCFRKKAN